VQPQSSHPADKTKHELDNLQIGDHFLPRRGTIDAAEEIVSIHDDVHRRVRQKRDDLQALRVEEPEEAHEDDGGMMKHMEETQRPLFKKKNYSVQKLIKLAEVVHIRPEKHRPGCASAQREAQHPLQLLQSFLLPPQPAAPASLEHGRIQAPSEHNQRSHRKHQVMYRGDESQTHRFVAVTEQELEHENRQQIQYHG